MVKDKKLVKERFQSGFKKYDRLASVQKYVSDELAGLAKEYAGDFKARRILEIGAGTGFLTERLVPVWPDAEWFINDISPETERFAGRFTENTKTEFLIGDAEKTDFPNDIDIIASSSSIQWFDDVESFIHKLPAKLSDGGYLFLSTFGPENFNEIKTVTGKGLEYKSKRQLEAILQQAGFKILHTIEKQEELYFDIPVDVLYHIKSMGFNSVTKEPWSRRHLNSFSEKYKKLFSSNSGAVRLTYHPVLLAARKL